MKLPSALKAVYLNRDYQFWLLQLAGWLGLAVVAFFTLTLWYNSVEVVYIAHTLLQSVLGIVCSSPLRWYFRSFWHRTFLVQFMLSSLGVLVASFVWSVARLQLYMWMTGETGLWSDFGGWYFSSFFVFVCWKAFYYSIKYYQLLQVEHRKTLEALTASKEAELNRLKAESVAREAQLKMLRYQLNPHFLFNTLNAIYALIKIEEFDRAKKMILKLSEFLRYSLDNDPGQCVDLAQEIKVLMLYLEIEKARFGKRLKLDFALGEKARLARVPSLLLQPLIENSIKYAIATSITGGCIRMRAKVVSNELCIELSDTGPGIEKNHMAALLEGRGVGLRNTMDRLKTLYGDAQSFDLAAAEPRGLKVNIRIPYDPIALVQNNTVLAG